VGNKHSARGSRENSDAQASFSSPLLGKARRADGERSAESMVHEPELAPDLGPRGPSLTYEGPCKVRVVPQGVSGESLMDSKQTAAMIASRGRRNSGLRLKALQARLQNIGKPKRPHRDRKKFK